MLQRTLAGMARHPNVGAFVLVGLGCEVNQIADLARNYDLAPVGQAAGLPLTNAKDVGQAGGLPTSTGVEPEGQAGGLFYSGAKPTGQAGGLSYKGLVIQEEGGIRKTVMAGIAAVEALLPLANAATREPLPISELMVALQCGGSDGWSGVTANPVLGLAADEIVRQGGSVVLAETPEIYGAEHLLIRRAISREVGEKLLHKVRWWEQHAARLNLEIDNNPAPGNKAGGLTTIYEKSLGAVAKAGGTPLMGVFDYAEPVTARGFSFMDTPGYDPVSVTGQAAGGCNLVVFTTGRGSVFGFKPAPSIKVSSNSITYQHMIDDMDVNAGRVLEGVPLQQVADELLDLIIAVASGQASKSEAQGVGEAEFDPWFLGGVL